MAAATGLAATWPGAIFLGLLQVVSDDRTAVLLVLAGILLCVVAGVAAARVARRTSVLGMRPSALALPARLLVVALALAGAAALLLNAVRFAGHDVGSWGWWEIPFFWYPVPALVLPLVVAFAVPAGTRDGLRLGWIAAAVPFHVLFFATAARVDSTSFTYAGLVAYAVLLPVLIAATFWRPPASDGEGRDRAEQRQPRRDTEGRPEPGDVRRGAAE
jgi:lysylphosphatidylglycerol synthetase-like protein (DUF2156 family)